ncbi:HD domain-containing protein [Nanoarchaeota archaeon]
MNDVVLARLDEDVKKVYDEALPYLEQGRAGDVEHVHDVMGELLDYKSDSAELDLRVLLPVAILHDIGHAAILEEHFKYLTGTDRLQNGKLVHMLTGAKIAKDILARAGYDPELSEQIVDIVAMHDADQVEGMGEEMFDTEAKKVFHDIDRLCIFNKGRFEKLIAKYGNKDKVEKTKGMLRKLVDGMFYDDLRQEAERRYQDIEYLLDNA